MSKINQNELQLQSRSQVQNARLFGVKLNNQLSKVKNLKTEDNHFQPLTWTLSEQILNLLLNTYYRPYCTNGEVVSTSHLLHELKAAELFLQVYGRKNTALKSIFL